MRNYAVTPCLQKTEFRYKEESVGRIFQKEVNEDYEQDQREKNILVMWQDSVSKAICVAITEKHNYYQSTAS